MTTVSHAIARLHERAHEYMYIVLDTLRTLVWSKIENDLPLAVVYTRLCLGFL